MDYKRNDSENYYSDDFESFSDNENENKMDNKTLRDTNPKIEKLIETVQFSDESDDEKPKKVDFNNKEKPNNINFNKKQSNDKQIVCELSKSDIKVYYFIL